MLAVNPEGLTAACGEHAEAVAHRLRAGGLSCKVLDRVTFKQEKQLEQNGLHTATRSDILVIHQISAQSTLTGIDKS
eukprot:scaffold208719_cov19-Tisochrysis_lutea.AAC.4